MTDRDNITLPREVAYQVPLHELLESVPLDARLVIDYADGRGTAFIPVGRYCHEAATALRTALAAEQPKPEPGLMELARQMKPLDADMAAILHDNLDSLYIEDEPALAAEPTKPKPVAWLSRDEARLALWKAINSREFGNPTDDKLILDHLRQQGLWIGKVTSPALAAEKRHPDYVIGNHWFETAYERLCAGEAEDAILEDYELVREPRLRDLRRDAERYRLVRRNQFYAEEYDAAVDAAIKREKR